MVMKSATCHLVAALVSQKLRMAVRVHCTALSTRSHHTNRSILRRMLAKWLSVVVHNIISNIAEFQETQKKLLSREVVN